MRSSFPGRGRAQRAPSEQVFVILPVLLTQLSNESSESVAGVLFCFSNVLHPTTPPCGSQGGASPSHLLPLPACCSPTQPAAGRFGRKGPSFLDNLSFYFALGYLIRG